MDLKQGFYRMAWEITRSDAFDFFYENIWKAKCTKPHKLDDLKDLIRTSLKNNN